MNPNDICENLSVTADGRTLLFAGRNVAELVEKYGSGLYVMDEGRIRRNARVYVEAMREYFGEGSCPLFASKACSFTQMYKIVEQEGMGVDVVSCGELYTAKNAGFPMEKVYFHGNLKTDGDLRYAIGCGVGCIVADCREEVDAIDRIAAELGVRQRVMLRLTPGIDPHTYEAVATGKVDCKFGFAIENGMAMEIALHTLDKTNVDLCGFHCHVGSMVFDSDVYIRTAQIMLDFIARLNADTGFVTRELDIGGGYGVRYVEDDPTIDIRANIAEVADTMKRLTAERGIPMPLVHMEPGRSIVADAGVTLYTVGAVKTIPGYKTYVCVDGGMGDNPRYALYRSPYTVVAADKLNEACDMLCDLAGRCCESGDVLQESIYLPHSLERGDLIAVLTTGAYNYSMASNYNRYPRFPVIMVDGERDYIAVRRESFADIVLNDL